MQMDVDVYGCRWMYMDGDGCGWMASCAPVWGFSGDLFKKRPKFAKIVEIASKQRFGWNMDGCGWMYVDVYMNADGLEEDWSPGKGRSQLE